MQQDAKNNVQPCH